MLTATVLVQNYQTPTNSWHKNKNGLLDLYVFPCRVRVRDIVNSNSPPNPHGMGHLQGRSRRSLDWVPLQCCDNTHPFTAVNGWMDLNDGDARGYTKICSKLRTMAKWCRKRWGHIALMELEKHPLLDYPPPSSIYKLRCSKQSSLCLWDLWLARPWERKGQESWS